jgi:two-component system heavy metal sensor histidine kinase CusS
MPPTTRNDRSSVGSITRRLAVLYTMATIVILVLASQFWYLALIESFAREDAGFLVDRINTVRRLLQDPGRRNVLHQQLALEGVAPYLVELHFTRLLQDGRVILQSPGMPAVLTTTLFPPPAPADDAPTGAKRWRSLEGRSYMLMSAEAQFDAHTGAPIVIQVAIDVSDTDAIVADYGLTLVIVLLLGVLAASAAGTVIARRGLRPLREMAEAATRISASQLHQRIGRDGRPRELAALANAFDRSLERLEDSFTRLSNFSADLAHELRTPINNLMGEAEVALERERTPDYYGKVLESSLEEYARLSSLIDSLLFVARAENAEVPIERRRFDARSEIAPVVEFYEAMASDTGVTLVCDGDTYVHADPILFRRALSNLLSNALRYTPRGGRVTVRVAPAPGGAAEISVNDTGAGIAPEHLPRIFDRFYRADTARSTSQRSVGLGLALVKSIMELHGGDCHVTSVQGQGTTVVLRFPGSGPHGARSAGQPARCFAPTCRRA